ncbi:PAS domain S-box protein [Leptolyngbya sp. CCNP1308]|uniref:PAS domain S-box protein n=1 Tax=Leptolyngbya sp. CCNP1308 TaxID=3110255 RepID=UPI002B21ECCB|nr:PAS domain S-box protein [Leptolyngbya sp. CCNP1308]MEA5449578.1 PAS domain S-box protein [Leptolyngbya sp. CCNP1308]
MGVDLAERVDQLQTTLSKMELALGAIADAILWTGCDNRVQWCNAAFDRLVDRDHTSILNQPLPQVLPLQVQGQGLARRDYPSFRVLAGDYQTAQYELCQGDQTRCLEISGSLIYFDDDYCSAVMVIRDVTEAKRRGEERQRHLFALQEAEHQYRSMFEHAPLGIYQTQLNGGCIKVNPALARLLGYESSAQFLADPVGMGGDRYCHGEDYQTLQQQLQADGTISGFEAGLWRQDGAPVWVSTSARLVTDSAGQSAYYEGFVVDIGDRKQAEASLRRTNSLLQAQQQAAIDGILVVDEHRRITWYNHRFREMWAIAQPELQTADDMTIVETVLNQLQDPDGFLAKIQQLYETPSARSQDEILLKDGRVFDRYSAPVVSDDGDYFGRIWFFRDITERRQLEESLRRSEAFLNSVVENIPITVFAKNIQDDYRYELINPNCDRILGFSHHMGLGKNDHDLLPAPLADHYRRQDQEIIAQGQTVENSEAITQPYTGETIYIRSLKVPLFDDDGQPTYLLGIGEDISERQRQEAALRLIVEGTAAQTGAAFFHTCVRYLAQVLNVRYAFLSEFNGDGTATTLAYWEDDAIAENFTYAIPGTPCAGLTPDQLLIYPRNVKALFPHSPKLQQMEAEGYMGAPLMHSSGHMLGHLAVLSATPLSENPGQELILKIFAARAGAELERKQAEDTFAKAFRSSPSPISITTLAEGRFVEVNPSYLRLTGYRRDDLIGQRVTDLNLGIDTPTYDQGIEDLIKAGVLHNREVDLRIRSGETRTILLSVELIELQGQRCALTIANDITERKRLENEFISLVSHELRTPMTALIGSLDLVATGQLGDLTPRGQQIVQVAVSNTERLIRLVNDILDLERMKSGQLTLHKTHCDLAGLLDQAIAAMQAMADQTQVTLVVESLPLRVWVDGDRMQQLLTNLLSNAIKFSPSGSTVWLQAQLEESEWVDGWIDSIHPPIHPFTSSPTLHLSITDQGRGIPADKLQLIFDRFQQIDASDARAKGGTGLGLAICRQIVHQHGGDIWAESTLGQGSTFHVLLPLTPDFG